MKNNKWGVLLGVCWMALLPPILYIVFLINNFLSVLGEIFIAPLYATPALLLQAIFHLPQGYLYEKSIYDRAFEHIGGVIVSLIFWSIVGGIYGRFLLKKQDDPNKKGLRTFLLLCLLSSVQLVISLVFMVLIASLEN